MTLEKSVSGQGRSVSPILSLEGVSLRASIGADLLLRDISFTVRPGEIIGIVGASGAGKTSLLRLLNGLISPSQGKIYLEGKAIDRYPAVELRRRLVLAPQEPKLLGMNVIDALAYPLKLQQRSESSIKTQVDFWCESLRISAELLAKNELQLSLGQRQLVTIARALIMEPQILMLDEPTSALDVGTAANLLEVLHKLNRQKNLTIMMVNHQLEQMQDFSDRLLLLDRGCLLEDTVASAANWKKVSQKIFALRAQEAEEWL